MHSLNVQVPEKALPLKIKGNGYFRNQKTSASFSNLVNEASKRKDAAFKKESSVKNAETLKEKNPSDKLTAAKETVSSKAGEKKERTSRKNTDVPAVS